MHTVVAMPCLHWIVHKTDSLSTTATQQMRTKRFYLTFNCTVGHSISILTADLANYFYLIITNDIVIKIATVNGAARNEISNWTQWTIKWESIEECQWAICWMNWCGVHCFGGSGTAYSIQFNGFYFDSMRFCLFLLRHRHCRQFSLLLLWFWYYFFSTFCVRLWFYAFIFICFVPWRCAYTVHANTINIIPFTILMENARVIILSFSILFFASSFIWFNLCDAPFSLSACRMRTIDEIKSYQITVYGNAQQRKHSERK